MTEARCATTDTASTPSRRPAVGTIPSRHRSASVRVLFVHGSLEIGGAEEVRLALLSHLDRRAYDVTVCCLQRGGVIAEEAAALGYRVVVLNRRAHAFSVPTLLGLRRLIRELRPDIVQTSLPRANYWGRIAAVMERVPVIIAEEHSVSERSDRVRPLVEQALGPRTDCVIAVSGSVREAVSAMDRASARRPTVVIPNPVNAARLAPKRSRSAVRQELGLADDQPVVVHAGRMTEARGAKGQDLLIGAMPRVVDALPNAVCILLGDGPARPRLEALAARSGVGERIRFLGYQRDVADYMAAGDAFVLPSRVEGMPIALMEAMWVGLPAIASDISANREALDDGRYGWLFAAGSAKGLADVIVSLARSVTEVTQRASQAAAYARVAFSPEAYAQRICELWERLLTAKACPSEVAQS